MPTDISVTVSTDVLCEQLSDEVVLLDMRSGLYFGLTPVASKFWLALESGKTAREAEIELLNTFDVPKLRLQQDLITLIAKLEEKQLISITTFADAA